MTRLDTYVAALAGAGRAAAKELIEGGHVAVNGVTITKPSAKVCPGDEVAANAPARKYAGRGGLKLEAALDAFGIDVGGCACLDVGASTGGFTDCLLARGAARVYAVDTGTAQLIERLRNDSRVVSMEQTNINSLNRADFPEVIRFACVDVSFVSATKVVAAVFEILHEDGRAVLLVKPQFEVGRARVGKGGIVKDRRARVLALEAVYDACAALGSPPLGLIRSPIAGGGGNTEYLLHFNRPGGGLAKEAFARAAKEVVYE